LGPTYASWLEARAPGAYERLYEQRRQREYSEHLGAIRNVLPLEQYVDYWIAEEALEFLRYPGTKPFFLWCGFCGPHGPVDPPTPYDELYPFDSVPLPRTRSDDPQASPKGRAKCPWAGDETVIRRWIAYYWGLVTLIDDMVGRLVSLLEDRDLLDDTLILFTSDHGEMAGDYNTFGKGNFYEEVIRVPLIIRPPASEGNAPKGRCIGDLVEVTDLAPTILEYAGIDRPMEMPAKSLRPVLEGRSSGRESILCEYVTNDQQRRGKCVRTRRYKYAFWGRDHEAELYDLHEDPDEQRNLAGEPAAAGVRQQMQELLLHRLQESEQVLHRDVTPSARDLKSWLD